MGLTRVVLPYLNHTNIFSICKVITFIISAAHTWKRVLYITRYIRFSGSFCSVIWGYGTNTKGGVGQHFFKGLANDFLGVWERHGIMDCLIVYIGLILKLNMIRNTSQYIQWHITWFL